MDDGSPAMRFTTASVRNAHTPEKARAEMAGDWGAHLIYRPLSFWPAACLLNAGLTPNAVTFSSMLLALLPPLLAWAVPGSYLAIAAVGILFAVLDCVDGNMARALGRTSALGQYTDFFADLLFRVANYLAIALLVEAVDPGSGAVAWLLGAALLAVFARLCRYYAEYRLELGDSRDIPAKANPGLADRVFVLVSGIDSLLPLLIVAAGLTGTLPWLLYWLVAYSLADFVQTQVSIYLQLHRAGARQGSGG